MSSSIAQSLHAIHTSARAGSGSARLVQGYDQNRSNFSIKHAASTPPSPISPKRQRRDSSSRPLITENNSSYLINAKQDLKIKLEAHAANLDARADLGFCMGSSILQKDDLDKKKQTLELKKLLDNVHDRSSQAQWQALRNACDTDIVKLPDFQKTFLSDIPPEIMTDIVRLALLDGGEDHTVNNYKNIVSVDKRIQDLLFDVISNDRNIARQISSSIIPLFAGMSPQGFSTSFEKILRCRHLEIPVTGDNTHLKILLDLVEKSDAKTVVFDFRETFLSEKAFLETEQSWRNMANTLEKSDPTCMPCNFSLHFSASHEDFSPKDLFDDYILCRNCAINREILRIAETLAGPKLESLILDEISIPDIKQLLRILTKSPDLRSLTIGGDYNGHGLTDADLHEVLQKTPNLEELRIYCYSNCHTDPELLFGCPKLMDGVSQLVNLKHLSLGNIAIGRMITHDAEMMRNLTNLQALETLEITECHIDDDHAEILAQILSGLKNLKSIKLDDLFNEALDGSAVRHIINAANHLNQLQLLHVTLDESITQNDSDVIIDALFKLINSKSTLTDLVLPADFFGPNGENRLRSACAAQDRLVNLSFERPMPMLG